MTEKNTPIPKDFLLPDQNLFDQQPFDDWVGEGSRTAGVAIDDFRGIMGTIIYDVGEELLREGMTLEMVRQRINNLGAAGQSTRRNAEVRKVAFELATRVTDLMELQYVYENLRSRGGKRSTDGVYYNSGIRSNKYPGAMYLTYTTWREKQMRS